MRWIQVENNKLYTQQSCAKSKAFKMFLTLNDIDFEAVQVDDVSEVPFTGTHIDTIPVFVGQGLVLHYDPEALKQLL